MKKACVIIPALLLTAAMIWMFPRLLRPQLPEIKDKTVLRIWVTEEEAAVGSWLKKRAAAYEKMTGQRTYLRMGKMQETDADLTPDAMIGAGGHTPVALRGYALAVRQDGAAPATPSPTSSLFFRPTATPGPTRQPAKTIDFAALPAVLSPGELLSALPGTVESRNPAEDFAAGKAGAALLTAGQMAKLQMGFQMYAVPDGKGLIPVLGRSETDAGADFIRFLLTDESQQALKNHGLYSETMRLYTPDDPARFLIDTSRLP